MNTAGNLAQFNTLMERCRASAFYRDRLPAGSLTSFAEFKSLPFTTKDQLREASPDGLLCVPKLEMLQYHESFGTTGRPVSVWLTAEDLAHNARALADWGGGFRPDDVVMVRFPYALSGVAHMVQAAAQLEGACVIPMDARTPVSPFPRVVELLRKLNVTVLCCLPVQAVLIAETAELLGLRPREDFPVLRAIRTAGEPLPRGRLELIQEIWGLPVHDHYGLTEIGPAALACEHGQLHPLLEDFIFEVLSEETMQDVRAGEVGLLVATTLKRRGTPLLRYITGDLVRFSASKCQCGKDVMMESHGRCESVMQINGRRLDLCDLDRIIAGLPCRRYWAAGPGAGGLHIVAEEEKGATEVPAELVRDLEAELRLPVRVEILPRGALYDRNMLLAVAEVGKPRYLYSAREMKEGVFLRSKLL